MSELLTVTVWIDPDKPKALEGYRNVLNFLKMHPDLTDEDKMAIYLLNINSRRSNTLVDIYFGLFKIKEIHEIKKSMTKLLAILLDSLAPPSITYKLTEQEEEKVTLVLSELHVDPEEALAPNLMTPGKPDAMETGDMNATLERIENFSSASNLKLPSKKETEKVPVNQVRADTATSVASSVTISARKASSTTSTVQTPTVQTPQRKTNESDPNPVTPNVTKMVDEDNTGFLTKMPAKSKDVNVDATGSQDTTLHTKPNKEETLFNLGTMPESEDTEIKNLDNFAVGFGQQVVDLTTPEPKIHGNDTGKEPQIHGNETGNAGEYVTTADNLGTSETTNTDVVTTKEPTQKTDTDKPATDEFVTITKGFRADTTFETRSAASKKSENTNSYALLAFEDADDDDIAQNRNENPEPSTDDEERSRDLLAPPTATVTTGSAALATGPKHPLFQKLHEFARQPTTDKGKDKSKITESQKPKKKQEPLPAIFKIPDQKLREHAYAMEAIEQKILRKRQNDVSVQDLAWYIANTKPRFGHMKATLMQECGAIQRDATKEFRKSTQLAIDNAEMDLSKKATVECNKLNNTSFKIMQEMKKVHETREQLETLHTTCSNLMGPMSVWSTQFITKTESDHQIDKINQNIASRMDHTEQLLHPLRNAIETLEKGTSQEVKALQATIQQLQHPNNSELTPRTGNTSGSLEFEAYKKELDAKLERQRMEITTLQNEIREQNMMMRNVYATKTDYELYRQQLRDIKTSTEGTTQQTAQDHTDLSLLKQQVQDIKTKLGNLATANRNPLFPNVDPTSIPPPTPTTSQHPTMTSHGTSHHNSPMPSSRGGTTHLRPPIPLASKTQPRYQSFPSINPFTGINGFSAFVPRRFACKLLRCK